MAEFQDFLVEIGTEELPPKALRRLAEAFLNGVTEGLRKAELSFRDAVYFAAPRRLAVRVHGLITRQHERTVERRGPALTAAFNSSGLPTPAAQGFARSCGVSVEQLEQITTDKGTWLVHRQVQPGMPTSQLLPDVIGRALEQLPIPKRMRWGAGQAQFVRPVHWVVMLFGKTVVDCEILGVAAGRQTRGHRFHHPVALYLAEPAAYEPLLETEGRVLVDFSARREAIFAQVSEAAVAAGGVAVIDDDLLDEVTALVEWPVALRGDFEARFLRLPESVLIATLQGHQRYFAVRADDGALLPCFVTVTNIESRDAAQVRAGNERVVRPRLEDAAFFYERDLAQPLQEHRAALDKVVFQKELGSIGDKVRRVTALCRNLAGQLRLDADESGHILRAADLSKCDLMCGVVGEFPELQGVMGRAYALAQGESTQVAQALDEQYMPRHAGDGLPASTSGRVLAIADKLDTLCGIFSTGQVPTGDKDPFGLRRAALGVLRTLIETDTALDLRQALAAACMPFNGARNSGALLADQVFAFMMERVRGYYLEQGIRPDVIEAVLAKSPSQPLDFSRRVCAVTQFRALPEAESLAAANKRTHNILRQAGVSAVTLVDASLLQLEAERELFAALAAVRQEVAPLLARADYEAALTRLAALRIPVDAFFEDVMVMVDDPAVRANRLALLADLGAAFSEVADISRLQG
jgi:glycyl-tRNA synthetase beta chain